MYRGDGAPRFVEDYSLQSKDPTVVRVIDTTRLKAVSPGKTDVVVRSNVGEHVLSIEVDADARLPIPAKHHTEVRRINGAELLFVGHANLDGWDHTAVAKPGIDRLVREFKQRGSPVVYFVSQDYPFWYTEDRQPDLAVVSEGQEHRILVDADRVVFTGGDFMVCTLRNAQMTLHGMLSAGDRESVHFVFPADAIWTGYRDPRSYPAPMTLLARRMSELSSAQERYELWVVPFLERLFNEFPVGGYPKIAPEPPLQELVNAWTVEVAIDNGFVHRYRSGSPRKLVRFEFLSGSTG
jgi:hypothetical protein